jgi:hypothetical protein
VIAFAIFVLAWNSRQFLNNHYFLFIGIAFLFAGVLDLLHTLAHKGMGFSRDMRTTVTDLILKTSNKVRGSRA